MKEISLDLSKALSRQVSASSAKVESTKDILRALEILKVVSKAA